MNEVGNIILLRNQIFTSNKGINFIDHAWKSGRPSIIVSETNNNFYVIPASTSSKEGKNKYVLTPNKVDYDYSKNKKTSLLKVSPFIETKICAYPIIGNVKTKYYLELLEFIINFYTYYDYRGDKYLYPYVLEDINNQILKLKR